ncbi:hypothetical protein [Bacteroides cellulosilyticus]|uniref:hypothetical protein n=1 Tax=Bacteroides cellulosilyticus TaxID=246787 RepID=UPI001E52E0C6|nr:hypothetical protein [Bacteroides cellulosilyticus]
MNILKFISNLFYDKETYFGSRCSGYGCYPSFDDAGIKKPFMYRLLKAGKKCGGCSDCKIEK